MSGMRLEQFQGMAPALSPRVLADTASALAINCDVSSGALRGIFQPKLLKDFGDEPVKRVYRIPTSPVDKWLAYADVNVDVIRSPLANEIDTRWYIFQNGEPPKYISEGRFSLGYPPSWLGIPIPNNAHTMTVPTGTPAVTRTYFYTVVTEFLEESAPSPPITATGKGDAVWTLTPTNLGAIITEHRQIVGIRWYRTAAGGAVYYRLTTADYDDMNEPFADGKSDSDIVKNQSLQSLTWSDPPTDIEGAVLHPGGFLVGYSNNEILFSEPFRPHAWPVNYRLSVEDRIVGLSVFGTTVAVMTKGTPYAVIGAKPASMQLSRGAALAPCLSKRSIVALPDGVLYASPDGLVRFDGRNPQVITSGLLRRDQWQRAVGSTPQAVLDRGGYLCLSRPGAGCRIGLTGDAPFQFWEGMVGAVGLQTDHLSTDIYLVNKNVWLWDQKNQPPMPYVWRSKEYHYPRPLNIGAGQLILAGVDPPDAGADPGGVSEWLGWDDFVTSDLDYLPDGTIARIFVYADRKLVQVIDRSTSSTFRLRGGYKATRYQVEVRSRREILALHLTETPAELANV